MYIKLTKSKQLTYVQLVEGYREGKKVKHKVLVNLGRLDLLQKNRSWEDVISKMSQLLKLKNILDIRSCEAAKISNWGYLAYKKLWKILRMDKMLLEIQRLGRTEFDFNNACFLMTINHLLNPCSKRGMYNNQTVYGQYHEVELNHLYRALDILSENKEKIEEQLFKVNRDLYNMEIDVVFYDVTTFHFESVKKDSLRNFGFSKANKINEVQVVLGMLIDNEGRPVGYELFSGNTFEGKTLEKALDKIEKRFGIRKVIIVADKGINSRLNLQQIANKGYGYIVASRIKNLKQEVHAQIFDNTDYQSLEGKNGFRYKVVDYNNVFKAEEKIVTLQEKLVITYSETRAEKDRRDRERLLEKAKFLLSNKSLIKSGNKRGGKKYLKEIGNTNWTLDEGALAKDERFDGYYAIQTSERDISVEKILSSYHSLWKIEESFRIMKSTLEVRPIFHWTENRIMGHFVVCFLAFLLERTMEIELRKAGVDASPQAIRDALNAMQFTETKCGREKYFLNTQITDVGAKILETLKMKPLADSGAMDKLNIENIIL